MINFLVAIGYVIITPLKLIAYILHIPNVKIVYKGGAVVKVFVKELSFDKSGGEITGAKWKTLDGKIQLIGVDDISAVFWMY